MTRHRSRVTRHRSRVTDVTINLRDNPYPEYQMAALVLGDRNVITFWFEEFRGVKYIKRWHTTDWDNAGYDVAKQKAREWGLEWER